MHIVPSREINDKRFEKVITVFVPSLGVYCSVHYDKLRESQMGNKGRVCRKSLNFSTDIKIICIRCFTALFLFTGCEVAAALC